MSPAQMLGILIPSCRSRVRESIGLSIVLCKISSPEQEESTFRFGPFNATTPRRWKKPTDSAQTRLENRTLDSSLDKLMGRLRKLEAVLKLQDIMSRRRGRHVLVEMLSRWRNIAGINVKIGAFIHRYPHVFEVYQHPIKRALCCKLTQKLCDLVEEEARVVGDSIPDCVHRLKKLLMMSTTGCLHVHALWLIRRELGLPDDFRDTILGKYKEDFTMVSPEVVELASRDEELAIAAVERWREREWREKWLSEFDTKYAFPIQFPTGFKIEKGFREKLRNWHRLQYLKPYNKAEVIKARTCGGVEQFEKRAVAMIHELLTLTVEKMIPVERLAHFRKGFSMEVNVREILLKHPGIFYLSTRGRVQTVVLREAYSRGCLIELNPIYEVRRKMLDLITLEGRHIRQPPVLDFAEKVEEQALDSNVGGGPTTDEGWVLSLLASCNKKVSSTG